MSSQFRWIRVEPIGNGMVFVECADWCFTEEQYALSAYDELLKVLALGRKLFVIRLWNVQGMICPTFLNQMIKLKENLGETGRVIFCEAQTQALCCIEPMKQRGFEIVRTTDEALGMAAVTT